MTTLTDAELRAFWRKHGGSFHGPNVETGTMPEAQLLPLLRSLLELPANTIKVQPHQIEFGGGTASYPKKLINHAQHLGSAMLQNLPEEERALIYEQSKVS